MSNEKVCQSRFFFLIVKLVFLVRYLTGVDRTNSLVFVLFCFVVFILFYVFCIYSVILSFHFFRGYNHGLCSCEVFAG